jgi:hypothetical protein
MAMNKKAVNRAAAFLGMIGNDEILSAAVAVISFETTGWDNPKETADTRGFIALVEEFAAELHSMKGKSNSEMAAVFKLGRDVKP